MKKIVLLFAIITIALLKLQAQARQDSIVYVVYKTTTIGAELDTYPHWFTPTRVLFTEVIGYEYLKEIKVKEGERTISTTDTIKYRREFEFHNKIVQENAKNQKQPLRERFFESNVVFRNQTFPENPQKYVVLDTIADMSKWLITNDTLTILGILCQKAETVFKGTKYTAFFTTKLSYPAGPKNFRGLPGLILQVYSESRKTNYFAVEITFPFKNKLPILDIQGKIINQKEYIRLMDISNSRPMIPPNFLNDKN